jgi:SAM-dependent methyltransferase
MNSEIIGLADWLETPAGNYLLDWEREQCDQAVSDIFGYHALQLGMSRLDALRANRMPHRWLAATGLPDTSATDDADRDDRTAGAAASSRPRAALATDPGALPFAAASLDMVVLPHTLELSRDPHATLREVERVLVPEGKVVIVGLNPASLWGMRQRRVRFYKRLGLDDQFLPESAELMGYWRLRDWIRLLSFEVESARFGCYRPAMTSHRWLGRFEWMDKAGRRWWPIFGAVYFVVAVKRVRGMRLLEPVRRPRKAAVGAPAAVANKDAASASSPAAVASQQVNQELHIT